jgi:hypothetical protein
MTLNKRGFQKFNITPYFTVVFIHNPLKMIWVVRSKKNYAHENEKAKNSIMGFQPSTPHELEGRNS